MSVMKVFKYIYYIICILLMQIHIVHAYVDPSVMTYAIQTIAGMAIALGTFLGLYWRRIKKYIEDRYHLNFNTNQIMETSNLYHGKDKEKSLYQDEIIFIKSSTEDDKPVSLKTGLTLSIGLSCLWMFYAPLQLYFTNINEFKYDIYAILPTILLMFVVGLLVGILVFFISIKINEKVYLFGIFVALILLLASFIQGNFLLSDLPALDGSSFEWDKHVVGNVSSLCVWTVVGVIVGYLYWKFNKRVFLFLANTCSMIIMLICIISLLINGIMMNGFANKRSAVVTKNNLFTYSTKRNFIIFVVDATDSEEFKKIMQDERPEYKTILKDFTYFPDTVCTYPFTMYSIPFILTGIWNENQEEFIPFETKAMDDSKLFKTLENLSYDMGIYETDIVYDSENIYRFSNIRKDRYRLDNIFEFARTNGRYVWFLYAPFQLKRVFSTQGMISVLQNRAIGENESSFSYVNGVFYNDLKSNQFTTSDKNCFRFIHIDGAHVPFHYDENVNDIPVSEANYNLAVKCTMTIVRDYLEKLKETGVYENSSIIIMSDHGYVDDDKTDRILGRENPLLLIKGFNETHDSMTISNQPISYDDLQDAYQRLLDGKYAQEIFDVKENEKRRRRFLAYDFTNSNHLYEYYQEGYASDESTLIPTGVEYVLP